MSLDPTIRAAIVGVMIKLEANEGVDAGPDPTLDGIAVEADSITYNTPFTTEQSNEATGSYVAGAPLIIGQAATLGFKCRIRGAGAGVTYSATQKPPLHPALQACGWRGVFGPQIGGNGGAALVAVTNGAATVTLANAFMLKFVGCRGTMNLDGKNARPGFATFSFSGIYAGKADASMPTLVLATQTPPVLAQGASIASAAVLNRFNVPIDTWSLDAGSQIEVPENPNTTYGFDAGQIVDRTPVLTVNPLSSLVAVRDTIGDIGAGNTMSAILRLGSVSGNAWSLLVPYAQPTDLDQATSGKLLRDTIKLQCRNAGKDATGRDNDRTLCFY